MNNLSINISKDGLAKVLLWVSFIVLMHVEFELIYVSFFFIFCLFFILDRKINFSLINVLIPLIVIFLVSIFSSFFIKTTAFNWLKDFTHLTKPILGILAGYYIVKSTNNKNYFLNFIVQFAIFSAIYHLFRIAINFDGFSPFSIRMAGGRDSIVELFGLCILLLSFGVDEWKKTMPKRKILWVAILFLSFLLYFSRTMFIGFVVIMVTFFGFTKLTRQRAIFIVAIISLLVGFIAILQTVPVKRMDKGEITFLYKIKMIPEEILNPNIDRQDHQKLWDRWRAYEAQRAIETANEEGLKGNLIGKGMGSIVDLRIVVPLDGVEMRYIPITHNGYAYVYLKSGLIGLLFLFYWLIYLYSFQYKIADTIAKEKLNLLISSIGIIYIITTLIISGVYNIQEIFPIVLGGLLCVYDKGR